MKRRNWIPLLLSLLLTLSLLAGCGSTAKEEAIEDNSVSQESAFDTNADRTPSEAPMAEEAGQDAAAPAVPAPKQDTKLIYRGSLELESTQFDDALKKLEDLVQHCGGYLESSNVYDRGNGYRSAEYVARVPADRYSEFFSQAGSVCHVLWKNEETENITRQYYDTVGRLKTQQTKLARLQDLLAKADSMEDIIALESAISETESVIESLSGELRYSDDLVNYSTVNISLQEVYKLSNTQEPAEDFGDRIGSSFAAGMKNFLNGMEDLLVWLAYNWLWIGLLVVILVLIHVLRKKWKARTPASRSEKKRRSRKQSKTEPPANPPQAP